jgi:hypothetical protein
MKPQKTSTELLNLLTDALSRRAECADIIVGRIRPVQNGEISTWEADFEPLPGKSLSPDSKRVALAALHDFRERFDLQ